MFSYVVFILSRLLDCQDKNDTADVFCATYLKNLGRNTLIEVKWHFGNDWVINIFNVV